MTKKFLLHKDKEKGNPSHIQAHLAAPTHRRPLRSQKSLHFADTQNNQELNCILAFNEQ